MNIIHHSLAEPRERERKSGAPRADVSQLRTVRALSMVSDVVKVLDTTTTSVVSGEKPCSACATSMGSTLARKCSERPRLMRADVGSVLRHGEEGGSQDDAP